MNRTFYIFGDFGEDYIQYPFDGTEVTFRRVATLSSRRKQCFVRRDGERMYYGFMRRLEGGSGQFVGVCLLEHGVMMRDVRPLMRLLEDSIENMAIADRLIGLDEGGNYVAHVTQLVEDRDEVERVRSVFGQRVDNISYLWRSLPQVNFGTSVDDIRSMALSVDPEEIAKACCNNGYLLLDTGEPVRRQPVRTSEGVDAQLLARKEAEYQQREATLRLEFQQKEASLLQELQQKETAFRQELQQKDTALAESEKKLHELQRRKPSSALRWLFAILLLAALAIGGYWGYGEVMKLMDSRDSTARISADLHRSNRSLVEDVNDLQEQLRQKESQFAELRQEMMQKDTIIEAMMDQYNVRQPLVTTAMWITREAGDGYSSSRLGSSASLRRGEELKVHFRYVGLREGTAHVQLNITTPGNTWWFIAAPRVEKRQIQVYPGSHEYDFGLWAPNKGYWESGRYTVELIMDDDIVRSQTWTVE